MRVSVGEWCLTKIGLGVDIGSSGNQRRHDSLVAILDSEVEWCATPIVLGVDIGPACNVCVDDVEPTPLCRLTQRHLLCQIHGCRGE